MEDLKFFAVNDGKHLWESRRAFWREVRKLLDSGLRIELKEELEKLLSLNLSTSRAMVRDFLEAIHTNEPTKVNYLPSLTALGLKEIKVRVKSYKFEAIQEHPEWQTILQKPDSEIPKLVNGGADEIKTLRNIIDEINDEELQLLISESLFFKADESHKKTALQTYGAIFNDIHWLKSLAKIFNKNIHTNRGIIELSLKRTHEHVPTQKEIRKQAALSLAYFVGSDRLSLFAKALTDEEQEVRKEADKALRYRQPSDAATLDMLIGLLDNASSQIRQEVAALLNAFYPASREENQKPWFKKLSRNRLPATYF